jgi:pyruvate/2-oxoglutarate dehydrogenase complex dihydrolipoamide dehydrogenase (E3) component
MSSYDYDLIVIGAGSGGISSANIGSRLGKKVALVERRRIGGDCTWYGCVPSKALIRSAEIAHLAGRITDYGLSSKESIELDSSAVLEHVRAVRARIYEGEKPEVFEKMGISVISGPARFLDSRRIAVGERTISSAKFVIATGSSPFVPPVEGLDSVPYLTNESLFELERLPRSLIIMGGGPIGIEMASALSRLGVDVTILQRGPAILPRDDRELVEILDTCLKNEGVKILTGTDAVSIASDENGIAVTVKGPGDVESVVTAEALLVSTGRVPNVEGLDLEKAGVRSSRKGIEVDRTMRTSADGIYAIGDVAGPYKFSHIAEYHAGIAVPNALLPLPVKRKADYSNIVWSTFTAPELAHAGLTEEEAREKHGDSIRVYRYRYDGIDRARTDMADTGMSKFICDRKGRLVGIHIIGERASDLLHEAQLAKTLGIPFHKIQSMIHIYPTYGDLVKRPATAAMAERLQNNFFIKLIGKFRK